MIAVIFHLIYSCSGITHGQPISSTSSYRPEHINNNFVNYEEEDESDFTDDHMESCRYISQKQEQARSDSKNSSFSSFYKFLMRPLHTVEAQPKSSRKVFLCNSFFFL